ncbi:SUMF1/EgtB/PvdO family nonheme iron enzyme [Salinivibrio sp. SS2]|uniref:SUMF1/EgtB/PvdO family nonheme iron enzyme n=1 Tax=Salinivibrio sp. SS2 TaxID=1892894 RepID=UPI00084CCB46|nr:SUMF1/EgtB/PvdO family nonheme iron enzyme [Salinivibrio sp. DV]ODQ01531.1 NirV precursor [Salinivibrio sp. DV]
MTTKYIKALCLALPPLLLTELAFAENASSADNIDPVSELVEKLRAKEDVLESQNDELALQQAKLDDLLVKRATLDDELSQLQRERSEAKAQLDAKFQDLIADPSTDIGPYQQAYQQAWQKVNNHQQEQAANESAIIEQKKLLAQQERQQALLATTLENLHEAMREARAERLRKELTQKDTIEVVHSVTCAPNMTLAACANQGKTLTMQQAIREFRGQVTDFVTESAAVKQNIDKVAFNIHVTNSEVVDAGFTGGTDYTTRIKAELVSRPGKTAACRLLDLEDRYCVETTQAQQQAKHKQQAKRWVNVTVRSNRYDDSVKINDVSYGSTPVELMLPVGTHELTVSKPGFMPYSREVYLGKDQVVWAKLEEQPNRPPSPGKKFTDPVSNNLEAPQMVVIGAGEYKVGPDARENVAVRHSFAIGSTPVTVAQFDAFVNATGYVTAAEQGNGCNMLVNGEISQSLESDWRQPGFDQAADSPVVCVNKKDANAYTKWLSQQTGHNYALPNDVQWEVAARGGTNSDFWWGNEIGVGNANTGWSGTVWSNTRTSPVKSFPPNPFGVYDTAGNVWEWVSSEEPIARGGAWNFSPQRARASERLDVGENMSANYLGFRVIRKI